MDGGSSYRQSPHRQQQTLAPLLVVWGGLHFVFDNEQGLILGEKVGHAVAQQWQSFYEFIQ